MSETYVVTQPRNYTINIQQSSGGSPQDANTVVLSDIRPRSHVVVVSSTPASNILQYVDPPLTENSIGTRGELRFDNEAVYISVLNNFWKKIDLLNFNDPLDTIDGGDI
jgi:hypothetical protein